MVKSSPEVGLPLTAPTWVIVPAMGAVTARAWPVWLSTRVHSRAPLLTVLFRPTLTLWMRLPLLSATTLTFLLWTVPSAETVLVKLP